MPFPTTGYQAAPRHGYTWPMCYSAQVIAKWRRFVHDTGARMSLPDFFEIAQRRLSDPAQYRLPRAFDLEFADPQTPEESAIKDLVNGYRKAQVLKLETEIFAQKKRLADAERKLAVKETKAAAESKRIAGTKVKQAMGKLALMTDDKPHSNDYRVFPRSFAPIIVMRNGEKLMVPARYLLRQPGKPAFMDDKLSGNYNARRDNLTKFWRKEFGATHAVMAIESFYENVAGPDGQNMVLHFNPKPAGVMLIACLFAEWSDPKAGEKLLSFAAVTDDPPKEVAAAGHDRMVIRLTPENVDRWLTPKGRSDEELQAMLSDRQPAYYEHRVAA
jgi:putative SOS response-associated peptidase YedK